MTAPASSLADLAVEAETCLAVVPFGRGRARQSKAALFCEKYLADARGESIEDRLAVVAARHKAAEARILEGSEPVKARAERVEDARREFESEREQVTKAMAVELQAAQAFSTAKARQAEVQKRAEEKSYVLLEAQKKLAMIQVMQENHAAIERLQLERAAALKAVQDFKRSIVEHRALERKAFGEATKKAAPTHASSKRKTSDGPVEGVVQAEIKVDAPAPKESKHQHVVGKEQEAEAQLPVDGDGLVEGVVEAEIKADAPAAKETQHQHVAGKEQEAEAQLSVDEDVLHAAGA